jgi:hypothetical protein
VCAPCGRVWREKGREVVKVVSGRVRMAGMTERETKTEEDGRECLIPKCEGRHFCTMTGRQRPRPRCKARCDGDTMHGTWAVEGSGQWRAVGSGGQSSGHDRLTSVALGQVVDCSAGLAAAGASSGSARKDLE